MVGTARYIHTAHTYKETVLGNPYTVTNLIDVWECDLAKYNDMHKYILSVIDVLRCGSHKDKE